MCVCVWPGERRGAPPRAIYRAPRCSSSASCASCALAGHGKPWVKAGLGWAGSAGVEGLELYRSRRLMSAERNRGRVSAGQAGPGWARLRAGQRVRRERAGVPASCWPAGRRLARCWFLLKKGRVDAGRWVASPQGRRRRTRADTHTHTRACATGVRLVNIPRAWRDGDEASRPGLRWPRWLNQRQPAPASPNPVS